VCACCVEWTLGTRNLSETLGVVPTATRGALATLSSQLLNGQSILAPHPCHASHPVGAIMAASLLSVAAFRAPTGGRSPVVRRRARAPAATIASYNPQPSDAKSVPRSAPGGVGVSSPTSVGVTMTSPLASRRAAALAPLAAAVLAALPAAAPPAARADTECTECSNSNSSLQPGDKAGALYMITLVHFQLNLSPV
jgi:hypothetical protein